MNYEIYHDLVDEQLYIRNVIEIILYTYLLQAHLWVNNK